MMMLTAKGPRLVLLLADALHLTYRMDPSWPEQRLVVRRNPKGHDWHIDLVAWYRFGHPARLVWV